MDGDVLGLDEVRGAGVVRLGMAEEGGAVGRGVMEGAGAHFHGDSGVEV